MNAIAFDNSEESVWAMRRFDDRSRPNYYIPPDVRDRGRIIHSAAFRRLQAKTQVLGIAESDFHRTRLTHTMEVAQIGSGIVHQLISNKQWEEYKQILPTAAQIEAICLAHDLGHPPFGHSGEIALNYSMRYHGGFEGNGQSLRIVARLEPHTPEYGLNLSRRLLLGILKYPAQYSAVARRFLVAELQSVPTKVWEPPKCYLDTEREVVSWVLEKLTDSDRTSFQKLKHDPSEVSPGRTTHKSLDSSILELADDIAYGVHDLEDGISLGLISQDCFAEKQLRDALDPWSHQHGLDTEELLLLLFGPTAREGGRKRAVGFLVNSFITSTGICEIDGFNCPLLKYRAKLASESEVVLKKLISLVRRKIIESQEIQTLEFRGRKIIVDLFDAFMSDPEKLLGEKNRKRLEQREPKERVVCDYIAGMTDVFANRFHERLHGSRAGSVFEKI